MDALTTVEVWQLAHVLRTGATGKVCGKLELAWGAGSHHSGYGFTIPSKGGKVCLGNASQAAKAVTFEAAPGSGDNKLFTLQGDAFKLHGLVIRDATPVVWRVQKPIPIAGANRNPAVWTPGVDTKKHEYSYNEIGTGRLLCCESTWQPWHVHWVLGFDDKGKPAIAVFGGRGMERFAPLDGVTITEPDPIALAAVRAEPSMYALPAEELAALATAIQREGKRKLQAPKATSVNPWRDAKEPSSHTRLAISNNVYRVVPSVKGAVMLGNPLAQQAAVKLELGGASNRCLRVRTCMIHGYLPLLGLRLSDELAVRWAIEGQLSSGPAAPEYDDAFLAFWSPGKAPWLVEPAKARDYQYEPGLLLERVTPNVTHHWIVGYDAKNKPAVVLVGTIEAVQGFDRGNVALADPTAAAKSVKKALAKAAAELAAMPRAPREDMYIE